MHREGVCRPGCGGWRSSHGLGRIILRENQGRKRGVRTVRESWAPPKHGKGYAQHNEVVQRVSPTHSRSLKETQLLKPEAVRSINKPCTPRNRSVRPAIGRRTRLFLQSLALPSHHARDRGAEERRPRVDSRPACSYRPRVPGGAWRPCAWPPSPSTGGLLLRARAPAPAVRFGGALPCAPAGGRELRAAGTVPWAAGPPPAAGGGEAFREDLHRRHVCDCDPRGGCPRPEAGVSGDWKDDKPLCLISPSLQSSRRRWLRWLSSTRSCLCQDAASWRHTHWHAGSGSTRLCGSFVRQPKGKRSVP